MWNINEYPGGKYGPRRTFDVVYDDGDAEADLDEIWVSDREEYELCLKKQEEDWIGVRNIRFPRCNDEYAETIGWYETWVDGVSHIYSSLGQALRSYDKVS